LRDVRDGVKVIAPELSAEFERLVGHHYIKLKTECVTAVMRRYAEDAIKRADDKWRFANPEKAALVDPDAGNAELGAVFLKIAPWAASTPQDHTG
jgi:hypothetical protein